MRGLLEGEHLPIEDVTPLVRPTRNQAEIDYLPPYGDPEVSIPGEFCTYLAVGFVLAKVLDRLDG